MTTDPRLRALRAYVLASRGMRLREPAGEDCPDGPRYRALGNSWAVPVVRWIGRRIDAALSPTPTPLLDAREGT